MRPGVVCLAWDSPSLYIISMAVTPGYKPPFSSQIGTMKQWGPEGGNGDP